MHNELLHMLLIRGATFVKAVDISTLPGYENRGFPVALLIGRALKPKYLERQFKEDEVDRSEFSKTEKGTDDLVDWAAEHLQKSGQKAISQSEKSLALHGWFDKDKKATPLPHKKIAVLAGLGWIGKNNLLVTQEYGCALSMSTVLTNMPLPTESKPAVVSGCGSCAVCRDICPVKAIHGVPWSADVGRDRIVNVYRCSSCLKCLVHCPFTKAYIKMNSLGIG